MKLSILIVSILGIILFNSNNSFVTNEVYAGVRPPDATLPDKGVIPDPEVTGVFEGTSFIDAVELIITWLLSLIGIIVFVIFLFAGFEYATAGDNQDKAKSAQSRMVNAVIGLIIIFFAFVASNAVLSFVFRSNTNTNTTNSTQNSSTNNNNNQNTNRNNRNN
jgi:amino acid transporter